MAESTRGVNGIIVLMTDFGLGDPFVGTIKGVIMSINPEARVVDLTHHISSFDIVHGAVVLKSSRAYFPEGTIFVAVVDPTVGSDRKSLLVEAGGSYLVGPDNGIFWPLLEERSPQRMVLLENESYFLDKVSRTFHGRDIFAPVAAWLSKGIDVAEFGPSIENIVELHIPHPTPSGDYMVTGEILFSDHFGNLTTNITRDMLQRMRKSSGKAVPCVSVRKVRIEGITSHYVQGNEPSALINSWGYLEIYLPMGNAREQLGVESGEPVWVTFE